VTPELLDIFWALNGATRIPRFENRRHKAVVMTLLPTSDPVPKTAIQGAFPPRWLIDANSCLKLLFKYASGINIFIRVENGWVL
jgi:hypothetical protein